MYPFKNQLGNKQSINYLYEIADKVIIKHDQFVMDPAIHRVWEVSGKRWPLALTVLRKTENFQYSLHVTFQKY